MKREEIDFCLRCTDHTSLNSCDNATTITAFVEAAISGDVLPATICVYPSMIEAVGLALGESPVGITAVCGSFPSGQTYLEVKLLEVAMAIENGADEIDIVLNIGEALAGNMDIVEAELAALKNEIGDDAAMKVILETGALKNDELIYKAAMVAMEAGADFIKTSTGKTEIGATPEAFRVMCVAAMDYYAETGRMVGVKCSGGISDFQTAQLYVDIAQEVLGQEWMNPSLFRIGSSKLFGVNNQN